MDSHPRNGLPQNSQAQNSQAQPGAKAGHPPVATGFIRLRVRLPRGETYTPGDLVRLSGIAPEHLGPIHVEPGEALVDVVHEHGKLVRAALDKVGPTGLVGWNWRWLRLGIGRNHGLSLGQLRRVLQQADALPAGKIQLNNTHTLVGVQDFRLPGVLERLGSARLNGFAVKAEALPAGTGPGDPAYRPDRR